MEAFATVGDLEARWKPLSGSDAERAEVLLEDASEWISSRLGSYEPSERALKIVCCNMVMRKMGKGNSVLGVTQMSQTAGSFNENITYSNPNGDFFITKGEEKMLGIRALKCSFFHPWSER